MKNALACGVALVAGWLILLPGSAQAAASAADLVPNTADVAALAGGGLAGWSVADPAVGLTANPLALAAGRSSSSHGLSTLPAAADSVVSGAVGAGNQAYWVGAKRGGLVASNAAGGLKSSFSSAGVAVTADGERLSLRLASVTEGGRSVRLRLSEPTAHHNRVVSSGREVSQWFVNGPLGLEQGFTLSRPSHAGTGPESARVSLATAGSLRPRLADASTAVDFVDATGTTVLRYSGLTVTDRQGRPVPARLAVNGSRMVIAVAPVPASAYPLRVDPWVQQGSTLTGSGDSGPGGFGNDVALSGDGTTAVVAASFDGYAGASPSSPVGAVFVFVKSGSTWTQQGPKIAVPSGYWSFGDSVAVSADGNTAIVDGNATNPNTLPPIGPTLWSVPAPVAFVLSRSGSSWSVSATLNQGQTEMVGDGYGSPGGICQLDISPPSVALSADGAEALLGDPCANDLNGTVYAYTRQNGSWSQQAALTSPNGSYATFGAYVSLSGDGTVALILQGGTSVTGTQTPNTEEGTWAFVRSGSAWSEKQEWADGVPSFAVSGDGNTLALGSDIWGRSSSTAAWTVQASLVVPPNFYSVAGSFGSVALSSDGNTFALGGDQVAGGGSDDTASALVYTRSGTTWSAATWLTPAGQDGDPSDTPVAVNACGSEVLFADDAYTDPGVGAAWVYASDSGAGDGSCAAATGGGGGKSGGGGGAYGGAIYDAAKATTSIKGASFTGDSAVGGQPDAGGDGGHGGNVPSSGANSVTGGKGGDGGAGGSGGSGGGGVLDSLGKSTMVGSVMSDNAVAGGGAAADCTNAAGDGCGGQGGAGGTGALPGQPGAAGANGMPGTGTDPNANIANGGLAKVTVSTTKLTAARVRHAYKFTLAAKGGVPFYQWTIKGLPKGLKLDASTGQITGKPKQARKYKLTVSATDPSSAERTTGKAKLALTVDTAAGKPPKGTRKKKGTAKKHKAHAARKQQSQGHTILATEAKKKGKPKKKTGSSTPAAACNQTKLQNQINHGGTLEFHGACTLQLTKTLTVPATDRNVVIDGDGHKVTIEGIDESSPLFDKDGAVSAFNVSGGLTLERLTIAHAEARGADGPTGITGPDGAPGAAGQPGSAGGAGTAGQSGKDGDGGGLYIAAGASATVEDVTFLDDSAVGGDGGTGGNGGDGGEGGTATGNGAPPSGGVGGKAGGSGSGANGLGGAIYNAGVLNVLGGSFSSDHAFGGNGGPGAPGGDAGDTAGS